MDFLSGVGARATRATDLTLLLSKVLFGLGTVFSIPSALAVEHCESAFAGSKLQHRVYYAHPLSIYDRPLEGRDLQRLTAMGYQVLNPNDPSVEAEFQKTNDFGVFLALVDRSDAVAVRAFADGKLGAGVAKEALRALQMGKPVFEILGYSKNSRTFIPLSSENVSSRALSIEETRAYLDRLGVIPPIKY